MYLKPSFNKRRLLPYKNTQFSNYVEIIKLELTLVFIQTPL